MKILEHERWKYRQVWAHEEYAVHSPGVRAWNELGLAKRFEEFEIETLLDAGAGSGRLAQEIARGTRPMKVTAMDLVLDGIVEQAKLHIADSIEGCLWNEADYQQREWDAVYCADVLEHIPTKFVEAVLLNLRKVTRRLTYLGICLRSDRFGPRLVGEPLHLTVENARWWEEKVAGAGWGTTVLREADENRLHLLLEP